MQQNNFHAEMQNILSTVTEINPYNNPLIGLENYSSEMTISQVIKYFERKGIYFTKTMIQNYVRINVLPPPADKRFYTKTHLAMLVIIDALKNHFSLDEIKQTFLPIYNDTNLLDQILSMYLSLHNQAISQWKADLPEIASECNNEIEKQVQSIPALYFITVLLMAQSAAAKVIAQHLIKNSFDR